MGGVQLDGVAVDDELVRDLAQRVHGPLGRKLEHALVLRAKVVGLTANERAAILAALENAPVELQPVRDALLADDRWRAPRRLS